MTKMSNLQQSGSKRKKPDTRPQQQQASQHRNNLPSVSKLEADEDYQCNHRQISVIYADKITADSNNKHLLTNWFQSCKKVKLDNDINATVSKEKLHSLESYIDNNSESSKNVADVKIDSPSCPAFLSVVACKSLQWKELNRENLCLQYAQFYNEREAGALLTFCEEELIYNEGDLATVKLFGKSIPIPRKQVAYGDPGLKYTFSGNTIPARAWTPWLSGIRDQISQTTGFNYNFVLINRYKDGHDYMGEHKDDEKDLYPGHPIASLTIGQARDFVFRHQDSRGRSARRKLDTLTVLLKNGMLLLMKHPTNSFWYHSLPRRTKAHGVRINFTFRLMMQSASKK